MMKHHIYLWHVLVVEMLNGKQWKTPIKGQCKY